MIKNGIEFEWPDDRLYDGIRQDATESVLRYRMVRNANWKNIGALTKDLGLRRINTDQPGSGSYDVRGGIDTVFNDDTQLLLAFIAESGATGVYSLDIATRSLGAKIATLANVVPDAVMFANKAILIDGTTLRSMTSGKVFATPGEATYSNPCRFGTVYANRLILAGNPNYPYNFFPSATRDETDWDPSLAVETTSVAGEEINCLGICGSFLIVGGSTYTRAYYLGTNSPRDWDWEEISGDVGPVNHRAFVHVPRAKGQAGRNYSFFWTRNGPMMLAQVGQSLPALYDLWRPIEMAVRGVDHQGFPALDRTAFDEVECTYVPEYREVRFTCRKLAAPAATQNDIILAVDIDSAIDFAMEQASYPKWRVRDNVNSAIASSTIFTARVDPATALPSLTGVEKAIVGKDGVLYQMDSPSKYTDDPAEALINFYVRRDGYDGHDDGIREHTKSPQRVYIRSNQTGNFTISVQILADGGRLSSRTDISLDEGLTIWSDNEDEGTWGDGSSWNEGEFSVKRGGLGAPGKKFDLEIFDDGNILDDFQINSLTLAGIIEDRR